METLSNVTCVCIQKTVCQMEQHGICNNFLRAHYLSDLAQILRPDTKHLFFIYKKLFFCSGGFSLTFYRYFVNRPNQSDNNENIGRSFGQYALYFPSGEYCPRPTASGNILALGKI